MVCLLLLGLLPAGQARAAEAPTYASRATIEPGSVAAGESVDIAAEVTSQVTNTMIVWVDVFDWIGRQVHHTEHKGQSFAAGETKTYDVAYTPALDALKGDYTVRVLLFSETMGALYHWNGEAGKFRVTEPVGPLHLSTAAVSTNTAVAGDTVTVTATVKSAVAKTMLVDVEVYDSVGRRVHQEMMDNQVFEAGETKDYSTAFTLPLDALKGTYTVKVGLFGAGMSTMLDWNNSAAQFTVTDRNLYTATATVSAAKILAGETVTATAEVSSLVDREMNVVVGLYDPYGQQVQERRFDGEMVLAGVPRQFPVTWASHEDDSPKGDYQVRISLHATDRAHMYLANNEAATFYVDRIDPYVASATVAPAVIRPGETVQVVASVRAKETVDALIDIEIYDERNHRVLQEVFDNQHLEAMTPQEWSVSWTPTAGVQGGEYTVKIGVFNPGWGILYFWQDIAATFTVDSPVEYSADVTVSAGTVQAGETIDIAATFASEGAVDVLLYAEVRNPSGARVYYDFIDNQHLAPGQPVTFPTTWAVPRSAASGTYKVRLGVFNPGWGILYWWENDGAEFVVEGGAEKPDEPLPPPPQDPRLPAHLGIGLAAYPSQNGLTGWMPESGVPWDYAYQYLAGGVNTGGGWAHWNRNGTFASNYAKLAGEQGAIPVFTYYQMLHSYGDCDYCEEPRRDLANLNNPQVMEQYFQDFILLLKRLSAETYDGVEGYGGTAIIHVEPDLSGYAQHAVMRADRCFGYCDGVGHDPSLLRAAVANSGVPEVADFPNTWQGFNWALLHLRDLYAPNVLLGFHVSGWGTMQDVGGSTDPYMNAWAIGEEIGAFAGASGVTDSPEGVSTYDLIFNDVADRDAGFYKYVLGRQHAFWDKTNQSFPNFHRWEEFLSGVVQTVQKPAVIWQIPLGNQYFATMNNTHRHYQDNRAEYFFDHIEELAKVGIVGLLFGSGDDNNSTHFDSRGDGVFNAEPICTTDGTSEGQVCNDHLSAYPDDDGGYLRMRAGEYYLDPYLLR
jgi:uncharacterized membrane protein